MTLTRPIALAVLATLGLAAAGAVAAPPAGQNYKLVYADEFNGSALDTYKWNEGYPWGSGRTHNHGGYADISQVKVNNGILNLHAVGVRHPNAPASIYRDDFGTIPMNYTTGVINSQGKLNLTTGYIEASMKLDGSIGAWPAFWMLGNGWPPEIDIMEFPRGSSAGPNNNTLVTNYHYTNDSGANASFYNVHGTGTDLTAGFNTYGLAWTANTMTFSLNGSVLKTVNNPNAIADAQNMYLLLNNGVDGWSPTPANPAAYDSPFLIDHVRVYQVNANAANATTTFQGTAASASWDAGANWSQGAPKYQDQIATFNNLGQASLAVNWNNSRAAGGVTFNTNKPVTLGTVAGSLQLASSGGFATIDVTAANVAAHAIGARLDLWSDTRVVQNSTSTLTISGKIVGNKGLLKGGTGTLILSGNNEFTGNAGFYGGTNSGDGGVVRVQSATALGGGLVVLPGTNNASQIIELASRDNLTVNNDLTTGGRSQPVFLRNAGGTNTWAGDLTISALGGGYAVEANGGTLTLAGTLSTNLGAGTSDRVFTLQGTGNGRVTGTLANGRGVNVGLAKAGAGTWTLASANAHSGGTTVSAGTLAVAHARALGSGPLTVAGGTLDATSTLIDGPIVVPSLAITGGALALGARTTLVLDHAAGASAATLAELRAHVDAARITAPAALAADARLGLAYADAATLGLAQLGGVALDGDAALLRVALLGDANLSDAVDFADLLTLARNYGQAADALWTDGDATHDGAVGFDDLLALARNYNQALTPAQSAAVSASFAADFALAQTLVPEPTTALTLGLLTTLTRRARRA